MTATLLHLPAEILCQILALLDPEDLGRVSVTCKRLLEISRVPALAGNVKIRMKHLQSQEGVEWFSKILAAKVEEGVQVKHLDVTMPYLYTSLNHYSTLMPTFVKALGGLASHLESLKLTRVNDSFTGSVYWYCNQIENSADDTWPAMERLRRLNLFRFNGPVVNQRFLTMFVFGKSCPRLEHIELHLATAEAVNDIVTLWGPNLVTFKVKKLRVVNQWPYNQYPEPDWENLAKKCVKLEHLQMPCCRPIEEWPHLAKLRTLKSFRFGFNSDAEALQGVQRLNWLTFTNLSKLSLSTPSEAHIVPFALKWPNLKVLCLTLTHALMKEFKSNMNQIAHQCRSIQELTVRVGARFPMDPLDRLDLERFPNVRHLTVDAYLGRPHRVQKKEPSRFMKEMFTSCPNARCVKTVVNRDEDLQAIRDGFESLDSLRLLLFWDFEMDARQLKDNVDKFQETILLNCEWPQQPRRRREGPIRLTPWTRGVWGTIKHKCQGKLSLQD